MTAHTPFIVVPQGLISANLYKCRDSEDPVYDRYAEGSLKNMVELAKQLNYVEAEAQGKLAVATEEFMKEPGVGIPTDDPVSVAERTLRRIREHVEAGDKGKLNLVEVKNHIHNELVLWNESPVR